MRKTYLVQTWDDHGALKNNYEVCIETDRELDELKKFLRTKYSHVLITHAVDPKPKPKKHGEK
jgi:hypothetical protein